MFYLEKGYLVSIEMVYSSKKYLINIKIQNISSEKKIDQTLKLFRSNRIEFLLEQLAFSLQDEKP